MQVIAVGAYDISTHTSEAQMRDVLPVCTSSRGPAADLRTKPDILGPTNVEAAIANSGNRLSIFTGTSAAQANVFGAFASFYFKTMSQYPNGGAPSPGQFIASVYAAGQAFSSAAALDSESGAGVYRPGYRTQASTWRTASMSGCADLELL